MRLRTVLLSMVASLFLLGGCGSPPKYNLPVDSTLKPYKAPSEEELSGADDVDLSKPMDDDDDEPEDPMLKDMMGDDDDDDDAPEAKAAEPKAEPKTKKGR